MAALPLGEAIGRSIRHVATHRGAALQAARPWYFVSCAGMFFGLALGGPILPDAGELNGWQAVALVANLVVQIVTVSIVATMWHRYSLLGEEIPARPAGMPVQSWRYMGASILIGIAVGLVAIISVAVLELATGQSAGGEEAGGGWMVWIGLAAAVLATARVSMVLPASALGRRLNFGAAVAMTAGNTWRIAACMMAIGLVTALPALFVAGLSMNLGGMLGPVLNIVFGNAIDFAGAILGASLLNHVYVWFDGRGPQDEALNI